MNYEKSHLKNGEITCHLANNSEKPQVVRNYNITWSLRVRTTILTSTLFLTCLKRNKYLTLNSNCAIQTPVEINIIIGKNLTRAPSHLPTYVCT